ncbi:MAG: hypothetical protein ABJB12_01180 [Pseudomonadota bacterium]
MSNQILTEKTMSSRSKHFTALCGVLALAGLAVGCGSAPSAPQTGSQTPAPAAAADFPGVDVGSTASTLLHTGACVGGSANGSTSLVVSVNNNETVYLTLRPTDNMVVVNGAATENCQLALAPTTAFPGQFPTGKTITIQAAGTVAANDSRTVILDYVNGLWGEATTGTTGVVNINLGTATGVNNTVKIRGSAVADAFYFGKGTGAATGPFPFNINGGAAAPLDAVPDVSLTNIQNLVVSTGPGNDKIVADGTFGTAAAYPNAIQMFGGAGNDVLTGGAGNDILSGDLGGDTMTGGAGANTYAMGAVPQGATGAGNFDTITVNSVMSVTANDTVDFSQRTGDLTVTLATVATGANGESGEGMVIPDTVSTILGGWGNDTITAAGSALKHTLKGGPGDDVLTGSSTAGVDTLVGGNGTATSGDGDDTFAGAKATVDYSARTNPVTVNLDSTGMSFSGDVTGTTVSVKTITAAGGTGTMTLPSMGISTLTGLAGMSAASVGQWITLSGTTGAKNDGTFKITHYTSATSVDIDVSKSATFVAEAAHAWSFLVDAHTRTIQPSVASVGTVTASTSTVTGLANMTSHDVGLFLVITASSNTGADDSPALGYKIVSVVDAGTVTVDASANTNWANDAGPFNWALQTNVDEADIVKAGSVNGSGTAANTITAIDGGVHRIVGGSANDVLTGGAGSDTIYGMDGNDTIYGGDGDDSLVGGNGTDNLYGGDGNDLLEGDAAADVFDCDGANAAGVLGSAPGNTDLTVDFTTGTDSPSTKPLDCEF